MNTEKTKTPVAGAADRAPDVAAMFDELAPKYDLGNRVLSLGLDQGWRRRALAALHESAQGTMLDLCAGTLDLTQMLIERGAEHVHAVDFSAQMLAAGQTKIQDESRVTIHCKDARELPLEDNSVDGIIAGFGLRNVPEVHLALAECARVIRPGGHIAVLDFFQPVGLVSKALSGSYNRMVVPIVGGLVTGFKDSYRYLHESMGAFCTAEEFVVLMDEAGFDANAQSMFPPVAHLIAGSRRAS
jgi:demethylmenaquinone methyltransferase/2-methoxy-6-polyprenyl-1,4-benzoquinol methylase